eukprot:CAMPEP_0114994568 /NCGR_PEP_ID=MMETSP0216-20121206/13217_1 /TAXON_ID=223996 /ORGANISM="Protocruzia adherens, Strain Boccale" /LENGTH=609 /DNA_ID=CAMNT_0002358455 /DNA_START=47 /DNA_END=1876 /DNA_ORIENTATION=+
MAEELDVSEHESQYKAEIPASRISIWGRWHETVQTPMSVIHNSNLEEPISKVEGSSSFVIMITERGRVYAWGQSKIGCLGLGLDKTVAKKSQVVRVSDRKCVDVRVGHSHVLALTSDGKVYSWGSNESGQLGIGEGEEEVFWEPRSVTIKGKVTGIVAHNDTSYAITKDGSVYSWGSNPDGILGKGSQSCIHLPQKLELEHKVERLEVLPGNKIVALTVPFFSEVLKRRGGVPDLVQVEQEVALGESVSKRSIYSQDTDRNLDSRSIFTEDVAKNLLKLFKKTEEMLMNFNLIDQKIEKALKPILVTENQMFGRYFQETEKNTPAVTVNKPAKLKLRESLNFILSLQNEFEEFCSSIKFEDFYARKFYQTWIEIMRECISLRKVHSIGAKMKIFYHRTKGGSFDEMVEALKKKKEEETAHQTAFELSNATCMKILEELRYLSDDILICQTGHSVVSLQTATYIADSMTTITQLWVVVNAMRKYIDEIRYKDAFFTKLEDQSEKIWGQYERLEMTALNKMKEKHHVDDQSHAILDLLDKSDKEIQDVLQALNEDMPTDENEALSIRTFSILMDNANLRLLINALQRSILMSKSRSRTEFSDSMMPDTSRV